MQKGDFIPERKLRNYSYDSEANDIGTTEYGQLCNPLRKLLDEDYEDHLHTRYDLRDLNKCREKPEFKEAGALAKWRAEKA
jgi:hypothetical protein